MNIVIKPRLHLLLLVRLYMLRAENRQKNLVRLVDMQGSGSSNKNYLNVLKDKDPRKRDRPSTLGNNDRRAKIPQQKIVVWQDNKIVENQDKRQEQIYNKKTKQ